MANNVEIGKIGENMAEKHLLENRYLILSRNHRENKYEIDIIARHKNGTFVFCEVKTINRIATSREDLLRFMPEDQLSRSKYIKMVRGAELFLARHPGLVNEMSGWQIDLIAIELMNESFYALRHYENL